LDQLEVLLAEGDIPAAQAMVNKIKARVSKRAGVGNMRQ
jgi:hypothetical protein